MTAQRNRAPRGAMFLAIGAGAMCFFISLFSLLWAGIAIGLARLDILAFGPARKTPMGPWEIFSLLVSLAFSALTTVIVYRSCRKWIGQGSPPF